MKRYFKNLLTAICGNDPFKKELEELKEEYEKTAKNVETLRDLYYKVLEKGARTEEQVAVLEKQAVGYQALVDNLRQRIREYQSRIKEYNEVIDQLGNGERNAVVDKLGND